MTIHRAQVELENCLKSTPEILIEETVNYRIDTAVEEGKPMSKRIDVDVNEPVLILSKPSIICKHHQCPQRQPGQNEEKGHKKKHFDHSLFLLRYSVAIVMAGFSTCWHSCFK